MKNKLYFKENLNEETIGIRFPPLRWTVTKLCKRRSCRSFRKEVINREDLLGTMVG